MTGSTPRGDVSDWWRTAIIEMEPGVIKFRGRPIEELIGTVSFPQMIWLMLRGDLPSQGQAHLLEAALVAAVDHGPQAPSIAAARMAVTCGVGINNAMASGVNMLGDVHGGAGEQAVVLYRDIAARQEAGASFEKAVQQGLDAHHDRRGKYVPGFGHRYHKPVDPRAPRLLVLVDEAAREGEVTGAYAAIGRAIQAELKTRKGTALAMNIDGATAVIFAELGFEPPLARGIFCLARSVGILAHAWEQMNQGGRNKGPTPPEYRWTYEGPE
ncbi:MAG: citryl-CoA lyase [Hyphomicrobiales bacterium]|nr:citryl-CoA lyase [Hyphomicrobiales bacterium]